MAITLKKKVVLEPISVRLPAEVRTDLRAYVQWAEENNYDTSDSEAAALLVEEALKNQKEFQTWRKQNPKAGSETPTTNRKSSAHA